MRTGKAVLGTMAGLVIGGIAGILFAPKKGSKTRKEIIDKGDDYVDKLKSRLDGIMDSLTEKFESTKKDAEKLAEKGKTKYDDAKKDVKKTAANLKHEAKADIKHATS